MAQQPESSGKTSRSSAASAAAAATNASDQGASAGATTSKTAQPVTTRRAQFMVASQQVPGLAPLAADVIAQSLSQAPGVEIVKTVKPPAALGLQALGAEAGVLGTFSAALGGGVNTAAGSMVVARMAPDKADLLRNQAAGRLVVEHDAPLTYGLDPGPLAAIPNVGVLKPLADGFKTTIEVQGPQGPLKDADVFLFGNMLPAQATTDASGRAELSIIGESPDTIRALYVKPKVDYWDLWMPSPALVPDGVNSVTVKPLSSFIEGFPDRQLLGWGQRAMGLDQVPTSFDGSGIKVAIIDSGAAQVTHRNLHKVGPGFDVVGDNKTGWTNDTVGHGSHCAGVIAGSASGTGIRGFAPAAEIHVLRIFPGARFSDLVGALDYCIENGIDVVNMSLGGGEPSKIVEDRLIKAKSMGVACVIAAGNSGGPVQFPASTVHALAVSAIGKSGEFPSDSFHATQPLQGFESRQGFFPAKFSCFGPEIDVCAPGVAIVSSLPPDDFGAWDGTSMAAPHVTGMAALVLAHHPDFKGPFAARNAHRVERLYQLIKESATPMPIADPTRVGVGLPNVARALGLQAGQGPRVASTSATDDPALQMLHRFLEALAAQRQNGHSIAAGLSPQSASVGLPPTALSSVGEARDLLHRAGLI
jgi:subtilisin family serine protease